jgi:CDGSH iron-sulfur domain-containing protein 2
MQKQLVRILQPIAFARNRRMMSTRINFQHELLTKRVVDSVKVNMGEQLALCRCWKSAKFPLCDGAHIAHNEETGDNVGPILVKGSAAGEGDVL